MKKSIIFLAAGLLLALPSAYANTIGPGGSVTPDPFSNTSNYTLVNSITGSGSFGDLSMSYSEYVAADQNNSFCAGCLDFAIVVTNTSSTSSGEYIQSVSAGSFAGFLTDVGYWTGSTGDAPSNITRSGGTGLSIHFTLAGGGIGTGSSSDYLVIETDATSYVPGTVTVEDGATINAAGFAPAPEPMTVGLLGGGLALLGLVGYRRRKAVKL